MFKISAKLKDEKKVAYLQDLVCNNPLIRDQVINNSTIEIIDQQSEQDS